MVLKNSLPEGAHETLEAMFCQVPFEVSRHMEVAVAEVTHVHLGPSSHSINAAGLVHQSTHLGTVPHQRGVHMQCHICV